MERPSKNPQKEEYLKNPGGVEDLFTPDELTKLEKMGITPEKLTLWNTTWGLITDRVLNFLRYVVGRENPKSNT